VSPAGLTSGEGKLCAPELLTFEHDMSSFCSREPDLDDWLKRRALKNQDSGASRTYVVTAGRAVVGYYSLAAGALSQESAPGRVRRNMPDPIPVMIVGRLAVDQAWQRKGLGRALLKDAILRTIQAADIAGIRAILIHALSQDAKAFYESSGFYASAVRPMTLMLTLQEARTMVEE
jgi:GNAT superfamily N-acetyltransferase